MGAIAVHGGCDENPVPPDIARRRRAGVAHACNEGYRVLHATGSALDAVEAAIRILEDDPVFDAGTGSYPNLVGDIEMDALLATSDGRAGGVAAIERVQHPISVARQVLQRTPHILLVGRGATSFARALGFPEYDPGTAEAREHHARQLESLSESLAELLPKYRAIRDGLKSTSTVGAVAVDDASLVVAGTSTGGIPQKLPGRVGDSAILGAGTYASASGGASASGVGEVIVRLNAARRLLEDVAAGTPAQPAAEALIGEFTRLRTPCGLVMLDAHGAPAAFHNGYFMPVAYRNGSLADAVSVGPVHADGAYLGGGAT